MIRPYVNADRERLCDFFFAIIENHKEYISHGELQMGVASDIGCLAIDGRRKWLEYLDRQAAESCNTILIEEENACIKGFILFGVTEDGGENFGMVFDLCVAPDERGKHMGKRLLQCAFDSFRKQGVKNCYLESGINNHGAHLFFEKQGFHQVSAIFRLKL